MTSALHPTLALLVHTSSDQMQFSGRSGGPKILSLHKILDSKAGPMLDGGRLLSKVEAQQLGALLCDPSSKISASDIAFNPVELLRETPTSMTWFRSPRKTTQHWRTSDGRVQIQAVLSGLVFHVEDGVLSVAAYAGDERPNERTRLFHAPLGNVYADSRVCCGNASLPRNCERSTMRGWESVLLNTNYTHINHQHTLAGGAKTEELLAFWTKRQRYATPPDIKFLSSMDVTLSSWVARQGKVGA